MPPLILKSFYSPPNFATKLSIPLSKTSSYRSNFCSWRSYVFQRIHFGFGGSSHSAGSRSPISRALIRSLPRYALSEAPWNCDRYATCRPHACRLKNLSAPGGFQSTVANPPVTGHTKNHWHPPKWRGREPKVICCAKLPIAKRNNACRGSSCLR